MLKSLKTYRGGDTVKFGFYWNLKEWEAQIVPKEGGQLKGHNEVGYLRMPLLVLLVVAPIMGAVYAFFLPFIGIAMVLMYLAGRLRSNTRTTPPALDASARATSEAAGKATASEKRAA